MRVTLGHRRRKDVASATASGRETCSSCFRNTFRAYATRSFDGGPGFAVASYSGSYLGIRERTVTSHASSFERRSASVSFGRK